MATAPKQQKAAEPALTPLEALRRINDMATSFMISQTFATACNLGVFERLSQAPATAEELARIVHIHPDGSRRLLAALRHLGLVRDGHGRFRNTELGAYLTSKSPLLLGPLSSWGAPWPHMWEYLPEALRELSPRWRQALNTTAEETFAALYEDPARLRWFTQLMDAYSIPEGHEVARRFDFSRRACVLDVAGGAGGFALEIGKQHPHLRGMVMDLPQVCKVAAERIREAGLESRFRAVPGDLLTGPYPRGADVLTLGWILHDWGEANCAKILGHCFAALPAGGVLLVNEAVLNEDFSGTRWAVLLSIHMAVVCESGARERSLGEYRALLEAAGFRRIELLRYGGTRDLLIAHKP